MRRTTVLGFDERVERVLAYAFLWISGVLLFMVEVRPTESSRNVRWHAVQSMLTFGTTLAFNRGCEPVEGYVGLGPHSWSADQLWAWLIIERAMVDNGHPVGVVDGNGMDASTLSLAIGRRVDALLCINKK